MLFKIILAVFVCAIYSCQGNPVPPSQNVPLPGDDNINWAALWNATKDDVSRTDTSNNSNLDVFERILRVNAKERGSGVGRSDMNVFLYEGDIQMDKSEAINIIQGRKVSQGTSRGKRAVMKKNTGRLWPKNIPYAISRSLNRVKTRIKNGIQEWQSTLRCMGKWRDVTNARRPRDYMYFIRGSGCYSQVGQVGGAQRVSIGNGCEYHGVIVHEIGHAMGLWHEQSRPDRDNYVTIYWNNIIPAMKFNFQKHSSSRIDSFNVPYDYDSVMHYGAYAFARYRGVRTIQSKPAGKRLGQRNGLSDKDKLQVQRLYGCSKTKPTTKPPVRPRPSGCQDLSRHCSHWKGKGYCAKQYVTFMRNNCCKTCCQDNHRLCPSWAKSEFCIKGPYIQYMKENCAKSCRIYIC